MGNWPTDDVPYSGKLEGTEFTAAYKTGFDLTHAPCPFREASLSGHFNEDFTAFDAVEVVVWGAPGSETTVTRHWTGERWR